MITANQFRDAFLATYDSTWKNLVSSGRRDAVWHVRPEWTNFMLKGGQSVISAVAEQLSLKRCDGEPLRLDAVFCHPDAQSWFPLQCAIEVENARGTFDQEIKKLLSIRCPLKVGITYVLRSDSDTEFKCGKNRTLETLRDLAYKTGGIVGEDPATEYLFLLGMEEEKYELSWNFLEYTAKDGIGSSLDFKPATLNVKAPP